MPPPGRRGFDKPKNIRSTLLRLLKYMMQFKWMLLAAVFMTVTANLLALKGPRLAGEAIDLIVGPNNVDFEGVLGYVKQMLVYYGASTIMNFLVSVFMIHVSRRVVYRMREDIFHKLGQLPISFYDQWQIGDILSRISYDTDTINMSVSSDIVMILSSVTTIVGSFVNMLELKPALLLIFAVTIPCAFFAARFNVKRTKPLFKARSASLGELNGFVEEMISGQKTLKAYHQEENTIRNYKGYNKRASDAYYKSEYYGSFMGPTVSFINNLSMAAVSVFGSLMFMAGSLTIGNISSFIQYSRKFSNPINEIANIYGDLQSALAAAERIFGLLDEPIEPLDAPNAKVLRDVKGDVSLQNVSFGYTKDRIILKDFSLEAPRGKMIAIVGPTGAGKTTFINMLMRFYDIDSGRITVDGQDISEVTRKSLRLAYSMVLQDTWLFHGTIFENIAYGTENATMEDVVRVAKAAKIHSYIMHLPQGYDTVLTDDGTNISKGQKQLMTIARAMLQDSNMLILDEATSNVDTRTEVQIQSAMRKLMQDKTCFVVAHRLSTIQHADMILVVRDGNIVERGTHRELMEARGFYRELYDAQFK